MQIGACTATITTGCLRLGRLFDIGGRRFEIGMDAYNLTNANTIYAVRTGTGRTNIRYANDASKPVTQIATFNSPTGMKR